MIGGYGTRPDELAAVSGAVLRHAEPIGELADRAAAVQIGDGDLGAAFSGVSGDYHAAVHGSVVAALRTHSAATAAFGTRLGDAHRRYLADDESGAGTVRAVAD